VTEVDIIMKTWKPVTILAVSRRQISRARMPGMLALCRP